MTPVSSMTLAASSPISAPMPRPLVKAPPGPFGPIPSDVMTPQRRRSVQALLVCASNLRRHEDIIRRQTGKAKMHLRAKRGGCLCKSPRHAESVDDEGRKHRSDVLVYDNVGNPIEFGRFAIDNHQTSAVSFG